MNELEKALPVASMKTRSKIQVVNGGPQTNTYSLNRDPMEKVASRGKFHR